MSVLNTFCFDASDELTCFKQLDDDGNGDDREDRSELGNEAFQPSPAYRITYGEYLRWIGGVTFLS